MRHLVENGWMIEHRMSLGSRIRPGPVDAVTRLDDGRYFALEWETGNISSTHRSLNKLALGLLEKVLAGGILVIPSRNMYHWLTDRIGNYQEIEPYFAIWKNQPISGGILGIIQVEHDNESLESPKIPKGTDGRALR